MKRNRTLAALGAAALFMALLSSCGKQEDDQVAKAATELKAKAEAAAQAAAQAAKAAAQEAEALVIATEAYVYAYPLVTMEVTRRIMTNVEAPKGTHAPMGQFSRARSYPDASFKDVTAPNADTLYTTTWLDVSKEPWILSIPDMKGRFFLFPMLDGWTNVFQDPGKRTTGTKAQKYAITGPGWTGSLPADVTEYKSQTGIVWILGRIYCTGTPEDYKAVHALQDQVSVVPLSAYGKPYTPPPGVVDPSIDVKTAVRDQVDAMDAASYFKLFAELLKTNPPAADDAPIVAKLAKIGVVPGQDFDVSKLEPAVAKGLARAPKPAQELIMGWMKGGIAAGDMKLENGWLFTTKTGQYGTSYLQRALITAIGLGANRPQDAVYPTSEGPNVLSKYSGEKKYVMRFEKGQLPPVNGFWSLTMYNAGYFFVDNPLNRYTLSQRNKFKSNPDGSVDLYIQHESPGKDKESNWLPAPKDEFILMMRLYWPKETPPSILDGSWKVPEVKEAS
ncbi:DUF1254 domain-containing protein [Niveibacterium sp. 24ML]|uniref:DUF1254 domain-containing protein n=1 Tax=Niveibacterium sp. 24ML TaxID=2985512 RepID=UPI00226FDC65|nr:DUF1254 domain-containing protein [Niveibacterium sp. 24ML]MCX9156387.1 DUF1254 domain-containing protein [Niveibacterium sp. 24ML]